MVVDGIDAVLYTITVAVGHPEVVAPEPVSVQRTLPAPAAMMLDVRMLVSVPCSAFELVMLDAEPAMATWPVVMPEMAPPEQPTVVAPPLASVHNAAAVPLTVPAERILASVPCRAFDDVIVPALAAIGT